MLWGPHIWREKPRKGDATWTNPDGLRRSLETLAGLFPLCDQGLKVLGSLYYSLTIISEGTKDLGF